MVLAILNTQHYIIPSDNREQQQNTAEAEQGAHYIIPSDNREQQQAFTNIR